MFTINYNRSDAQIEELNKKVRPLVKKGFFGKLCYTTLTPADDDYRKEVPVCVAKGLSKIKEVEIRVPTCGYKGNVLVTPKIVFAQLSNRDLKGASAYYVEVEYPKEDILELYTSDFLDAKVHLFGEKNASKIDNRQAKTK